MVFLGGNFLFGLFSFGGRVGTGALFWVNISTEPLIYVAYQPNAVLFCFYCPCALHEAETALLKSTPPFFLFCFFIFMASSRRNKVRLWGQLSETDRTECYKKKEKKKKRVKST